MNSHEELRELEAREFEQRLETSEMLLEAEKQKNKKLQALLTTSTNIRNTLSEELVESQQKCGKLEELVEKQTQLLAHQQQQQYPSPHGDHSSPILTPHRRPFSQQVTNHQQQHDVPAIDGSNSPGAVAGLTALIERLKKENSELQKKNDTLNVSLMRLKNEGDDRPPGSPSRSDGGSSHHSQPYTSNGITDGAETIKLRRDNTRLEKQLRACEKALQEAQAERAELEEALDWHKMELLSLRHPALQQPVNGHHGAGAPLPRTHPRSGIASRSHSQDARSASASGRPPIGATSTPRKAPTSTVGGGGSATKGTPRGRPTSPLKQLVQPVWRGANSGARPISPRQERGTESKRSGSALGGVSPRTYQRSPSARSNSQYSRSGSTLTAPTAASSARKGAIQDQYDHLHHDPHNTSGSGHNNQRTTTGFRSRSTSVDYRTGTSAAPRASTVAAPASSAAAPPGGRSPNRSRTAGGNVSPRRVSNVSPRRHHEVPPSANSSGHGRIGGARPTLHSLAKEHKVSEAILREYNPEVAHISSIAPLPPDVAIRIPLTPHPRDDRVLSNDELAPTAAPSHSPPRGSPPAPTSNASTAEPAAASFSFSSTPAEHFGEPGSSRGGIARRGDHPPQQSSPPSTKLLRTTSNYTEHRSGSAAKRYTSLLGDDDEDIEPGISHRSPGKQHMNLLSDGYNAPPPMLAPRSTSATSAPASSTAATAGPGSSTHSRQSSVEATAVAVDDDE